MCFMSLLDECGECMQSDSMNRATCGQVGMYRSSIILGNGHVLYHLGSSHSSLSTSLLSDLNLAAHIPIDINGT